MGNRTRTRRWHSTFARFAAGFALLAASAVSQAQQPWSADAGPLLVQYFGTDVNRLYEFGTAPNNSLSGSYPFLQSANGQLVSIVGPSTFTVNGTTVTVAIEGDACVRLSYTGTPSGSGTNFNFSVRARDVATGQLVDKVISTVQGGSGTTPGGVACDRNYAPIAQNPTAPGNEDAPLTIPATDLATDADGQAVTVTSVNAPSPANAGTAVIQGGGTSILFTPSSNFSGAVTIGYLATAGGQSVSGTLAINVAAVNDPPQGLPTTASHTLADAFTDINVFSGVTDPEGNTFSIQSVGAVTGGGNAGALPGNPGIIRYTPDPNAQAGQTPSFTYVLVDDGSPAQTASALMRVTISASQNTAPTAVIAAVTSPIADSDQVAGETVAVNGTASSDAQTPAGQLTYTWDVDNVVQTNAVGGNPQLRVPDGSHTIGLVVGDGTLNSSRVTISVVINAFAPGQAPVITLNALDGASIPDSDGQAGESVSFSGTAIDPDNVAGQQNIPAANFTWRVLVNGQIVQTVTAQTSLDLPLPDGLSIVRLTVVDDDGVSSFQEQAMSIASPQRSLAAAALTPNQRALAQAIDNLCPKMAQHSAELNNTQAQLLGLCTNLKDERNTQGAQRNGLDAIGGEKITSQSTTGIDFSKVQVSNLGARLTALRQGARGVSVAGLSIVNEGKAVPLTQLGQMVKALANGGASGDDDPGGLLDGKLGIFINGNVLTGEKDRTLNEAGFDFDSYGVTIGADYRFTDKLVFGLAGGYGKSKTELDADGGRIDSKSWSGSVYGTWYRDRLYFDFVGSYGKLDYDSLRNITYVDVGSSVSAAASGATDGKLKSFGMSMGYDLGRKGWSFVPTIALTTMQVDIDGFTEAGANALDLSFGGQQAKSSTAQGGFRAGYNFSRKWGVISPQVRATFIKEFQNDRDAVTVRFVNDPFSNTPDGTDTGFIVVTDDPDDQYMRFGASVSALFTRGVSLFVDWETVSSLEAISSNEFTVGLRFERAF